MLALGVLVAVFLPEVVVTLLTLLHSMYIVGDLLYPQVYPMIFVFDFNKGCM